MLVAVVDFADVDGVEGKSNVLLDRGLPAPCWACMINDLPSITVIAATVSIRYASILNVGCVAGGRNINRGNCVVVEDIA